jgi:hypothetical protein
MSKFRLLFCCLIGSIGIYRECQSQILDVQSDLFELPSPNYIRFFYENDLFAGIDEDYSQGFVLEFGHEKLNAIFPPMFKRGLFQNSSRTSLSFTHFVYTPGDLRADSILFNDRPYAANFQIGIKKSKRFPEKKMRLSKYSFAGVMGDIAFGNAMQTGIHTVTGNDLPQGWKYQMANEPIFGYQLRVEKEIFNLSNVLSGNLLSQLQLGNLKTNTSLGAEMRIGTKIWKLTSDQQMHFSLYSQSWVHLIGYDATLQGGLFNKSSVNVLSSSEVNRLVFEQHVGFQIFRNRLSFAFDFAYRTQEYSYGTNHFWGGLRIARIFKNRD